MPEEAIFVVDDDPDVRHSLRFLIESVGLDVREFSNARDFLDRVESDIGGCVVLDMRMPGMSGLEMQAAVRDRGIELPVIILTGHGEVSLAVQAMKAGAFDFVEKPFSDQQLLQSIQEALELNRLGREEIRHRREVQSRVSRLTPRERQVLELVVDGHSNKSVAAALSVSCKTIEAHRANMMRKMHAANVADLVRLHLALSA